MDNQIVYSGPGSLHKLESVIESLDRKKLFAVVDQVAFLHSGAESMMGSLLARNDVSSFSGFQANPRFEDVTLGIRNYRQFKPDAVLAFGGGTAIDLAKLISCLAFIEQPDQVILGRAKVPTRQGRIIAIPTTAGTGSEATQFAVVYLGGQKYSLDHPSLLPDVAIVDSHLTLTLPASITASSGLDALCQAVESIWAVAATDQSIAWGVESLELSLNHIVKATLHPTPNDREAMCQAAHLAGKAINVTRTTACHALSYSMTSKFGIPHGVAVALTLAQMLRFNAAVNQDDCMDRRGAPAVRDRIAIILKCFKSDTVDAAGHKFRQLLQNIGCPRTPAEAGITQPADIQQIVDSVNVQRLQNNPRRTTAAALHQVLTGGLDS